MTDARISRVAGPRRAKPSGTSTRFGSDAAWRPRRTGGAEGASPTRLARRLLSTGLAALLVIVVITFDVGTVPAARAQEAPCSDVAPLPEGVTVIFDGDDFDTSTLSEFCRGVVEADAFFAEFDTVLSGATIYAVDSVERARRRRSAPPGRTWGGDLYGFALGRRVVILLLPGRFSRMMVLHELMHVVQAPTLEAQWLAEGAAEYVTRRQVYIANGRSLDDFPSTTGWAYDWSLGEVDLADLESARAFNRSSGPNYLASRVAFSLLVEDATGGLDSYFGCFIPEKKTRSWRTAFSTCFDMDVSGFYAAFDEYRSSGFTETPGQRRERERVEFQWSVDSCMVRPNSAGSWTIRSMC